MKRKTQKTHQRARYALAGGSMLAAGFLLMDLQNVLQPSPPKNVCQAVVQSQSVLSRDELARLIEVPERSNKAAVRAIVSEPYCKLAPVEIRAGASAEREAYPLAFDPKTWFVVLYEGDEYAGYDFVFQR
jgi:hypothetical protein